MKKTFKVFLVIMGLGLGLLLALHLFLQHGLTRTLRDIVLPLVKEETGLDIHIEHLSLNVPKGRFYLNNVAVRNPDDFVLENMASIERIAIEVDLLQLLKKKTIYVKTVDIDTALFNIIRNQKGDLNIENLLQAKKPEEPGVEKKPEEAAELPQMLIEALHGSARLRYLDFQFNELDLSLDLDIYSRNLSTLRDPDAAWGETVISNSVGSQHTRFVTHLVLETAPITNPELLTFNLTGEILGIDPRIMEKLFKKLGIRSDPFGLITELHCRDNHFETSAIQFELKKIQLEAKLSDHLGGMGSIDSLRFTVPITGTLDDPSVDVELALKKAFGDNSPALLDALLKGAVAKELGESETAKKLLKKLEGKTSSDTNAPPAVSSDALIDLLGEKIDEIGKDEELKKGLKNLGRQLLGH